MASPVGITFDVSTVSKNVTFLLNKATTNKQKVCLDIAEDILRKSQEVVPIDTSMLQQSGLARPEMDGAIVGYNKPYAMYQHEGQRSDGSRVVKNYSNPRSKRKFLENPIKQNLRHYVQYYKSLFK